VDGGVNIEYECVFALRKPRNIETYERRGAIGNCQALSEDDDPGDRPGRFIIAGVSDTSALIAYEMYGYVPTTHATACVHAKSDWIVAKKWDAVGYPKTLSELRMSVERFAKPVTGR
jgi:hypothetical protein